MKRSLLIALALILILSVSLSPIGGLAMGFVTPGPSSATPGKTPEPGNLQSLSPTPTLSPEDQDGRFAITNTKGVNVRAKASTKASVVKSIPVIGSLPFRIIEEVNVTKTEVWYKVEFQDGDKTKTGFIRSDLVDEITPEEYAALVISIAEAEAEKASSIYVWLTDSGSKYHSKKTCSGMKNAYSVTLEKAKSRGYGPCKNCNPPR